MSVAAIFNQPLPAISLRPGGDCAPYTKPAPTAVVTDLDRVPVFQPPAAIVTDLCSEVS